MAKRIQSMLDMHLNNLIMKKKLFLLYFCCVMLPLVVTDTVIVGIIVKNEYDTKQERMKNDISSVEYTLNTAAEEAVSLSKNIYFNKYINNFLNTEFESPLDYYNQYQDLLRDSLFDSSLGTSNAIITMYADNLTLVNGGKFWKINSIENQEWYGEFMDSGQEMQIYFYYDDYRTTELTPLRKASFVRRLDRYKRDPYEKLLKIDLDYAGINQNLVMANYENDIYVCNRDRIVFSNKGNTSQQQNYERMGGIYQKRGAYMEKTGFYGQELEIYVIPQNSNFFKIILHYLPQIFLLIFINILMPYIFMQTLGRTFVDRLGILSRTFNYRNQGKLEEIKEIQGTDEIASLMRNYNIMAKETNHLIETVYKSRLKQQEMNIARQKAELLALHGQINPHFLFNILENIRMRSVLKHENETAEMIEKLSIMERQYVEWGTDMLTIREESRFVEAYLNLQKYRFGNRLSYSIDIEEACFEYRIPKLSLVTFAENSCVHGIEDKAAKCWIFVKVYKNRDKLFMEIEDTGSGMSETYLCYLREKMENANIEMLKEKGRVGVVNTCLRLKMLTEGIVRFTLESEVGVGTIVTISAPVKYFEEGTKC